MARNDHGYNPPPDPDPDCVEGADSPPEHDEERARREFHLLTADEARTKARERLENWRATHPGVQINERERQDG